jgi:hypothetical protein
MAAACAGGRTLDRIHVTDEVFARDVEKELAGHPFSGDGYLL